MSTCLNKTISISSGRRTKKQNDKLVKEGRAVKNSYHLYGLAADVHTPPSKSKLRKAAEECGFHVLSTDYPTFVHVDLRDGRTPKEIPVNVSVKN